MYNIPRYVGGKIKDLRKKNNLTQSELGKKMELSNTTISAYERGEISPDPTTLYALANFFEVPVNFFFPPIEDDEILSRLDKDALSDSINLKDMRFLQELAEKVLQLQGEEREKFLESIRFSVEYYKRFSK